MTGAVPKQSRPQGFGAQVGPPGFDATRWPALALEPGQSWTHVHATVHLVGDRKALDGIARAVFGVSLDEIEAAFR